MKRRSAGIAIMRSGSLRGFGGSRRCGGWRALGMMRRFSRWRWRWSERVRPSESASQRATRKLKSGQRIRGMAAHSFPTENTYRDWEDLQAPLDAIHKIPRGRRSHHASASWVTPVNSTPSTVMSSFCPNTWASCAMEAAGLTADLPASARSRRAHWRDSWPRSRHR